MTPTLKYKTKQRANYFLGTAAQQPVRDSMGQGTLFYYAITIEIRVFTFQLS